MSERLQAILGIVVATGLAVIGLRCVVTQRAISIGRGAFISNGSYMMTGTPAMIMGGAWCSAAIALLMWSWRRRGITTIGWYRVCSIIMYSGVVVALAAWMITVGLEVRSLRL